MTAARAAYEKGVAPGGTFAISSGSFDGSNVTLTFPGDWPADAYVVKYGPTSECGAGSLSPIQFSTANSQNMVTVTPDMGTGTVLYYKVARSVN